MAIKITCNGNIGDVKIIDTESGVELQDKCTKAHITMDASGKCPEAILHFTDVRLDVVAEIVKTLPPTGLRFDGFFGE